MELTAPGTDPTFVTAPGDGSGHVVVCGLHDEGLRVVEQLLAAGIRVIVVDDVPDATLVPALDLLGVPLLAADSRLPATLIAADFDKALALICVESDDVRTLATALSARELRPDARVVVQLRNAAVGRAMADVGITVLDVAGLAAPSLVEAALQTGRTVLRLGDDDVAVVEAECRQAGTLRDLYGDLAPLGVIRADSSAVEIAPGRDLEVRPGDVVVVAGAPAEVARAGLSGDLRQREERAFVSARAPRVPRVRRRSWLRHFVAGLERRVKLAIGGLAGLAGFSVLMLMLGYREPDGTRMSPLDALYFTVETIGTVGYGDFYFRDQDTWLRLWAICLMLVGATLVGVFFALLTNALVTRRLEETLGSRRITGLDRHVVVVGSGSLGVEVARRLHERGSDLVVIDRDPQNRFLGVLRALRIPALVADATLPETWSRLHLDRARAIVVASSDDLVNLETGLAVRDLLGDRWADVPVVLRIFDTHLAATIEATFGFRFVRSPAALAAPWFVGAALGLEVIDTFYLGGRPLLVARLELSADSGLAGRAMGELSARIRVLSLVRADGVVELPPRRETRFRAGDAAYLVGPYEELLGLLRTDTATA